MMSVAEATGGTGDSQYAFERRLRWMRIRIGIMAPLAAISLVVSHFVQPVPPTYLLAMFGLEIAVGALMIVSRGVNNIWWGFLLGGVFGGLVPSLEDLFLPDTNGDFGAALWQGCPRLSAA